MMYVTWIAIIMLNILCYDNYVIASLCPQQGWYNSDLDTCYWMVTFETSAADSHYYCGLSNGQLAVFPNQTSLDWITSQHSSDITSVTSKFWIGKTDSTTEGTYLTYKGQPYSWASWASGQPSDDGNMDRDCVVIDISTSWKMADESCDNELPGLCSLILDYCPSGSVYLPTYGLCYWVTSQPESVGYDNEFYCSVDGGAPAVIPSAAVDNEFNYPPLSNLLTGITNLMIGVTDSKTESVYLTYDDAPLTWTNWKSGEPNDPDINSFPAQDCVMMDTTNREWSDYVCTSTVRGLCYRDLGAFVAVDVTYPTLTEETTTTEIQTTSTGATTTSTQTTSTTIDIQTTSGDATTSTTEMPTRKEATTTYIPTANTETTTTEALTTSTVATSTSTQTTSTTTEKQATTSTTDMPTTRKESATTDIPTTNTETTTTEAPTKSTQATSTSTEATTTKEETVTNTKVTTTTSTDVVQTTSTCTAQAAAPTSNTVAPAKISDQIEETRWRVAEEYSECIPVPSVMWSTSSRSLEECVHFCFQDHTCALVSFRNDIQTCNGYSNSVPRHQSCTSYPGAKTYRNIKTGCTDNGFIYDRKSGLCAKVYTQITLWKNAKEICKQDGLELVIVDTVDKHLFIKNLIKSNSDWEGKSYWIGGSTSQPCYPGSWRWWNDLTMPSSNTYWDPTAVKGPNSLLCAYLCDTCDYQWKSAPCLHILPFVCEKVLI